MGRPHNRKFGGRTDVTQKPIVAALRDAGCTVRITSMLGDGFVDALVWSPFTRSCHLLEIKTGKKKLTPQEDAFHKAWPGPIAIVRTVDEALRAIGALARDDLEADLAAWAIWQAKPRQGTEQG